MKGDSECVFEIVQIEKIIGLKTNSIGEKRKWMNLLEEYSQYSRKDEDDQVEKEEYLGTLRVTIIEGRNLEPITPKGNILLNFKGKSNPYLIVQLNKQKLQTKAEKDTLNPYWNQSLIFSVSSLDDILRITCYNYEKYSYNEYMGEIELPLNFLEYYGEKSTEMITLNFKDKRGSVIIQMNYKIA